MGNVPSFVSDFYASPCNTAHILGMVIWWFYLWNYDIPVEKVATQYDKLLNGEYWRAISANVAHKNILHIGFNMVSMYSVAWVEQYLGWVDYLKVTFILMIGSELVIFLITYIAVNFFHRHQMRTTYSLGFSCVVFGWITLASMINNGEMNFFGLAIPYFVYPFASLIFTSLLIPNASFIGHLSGIVIGFLISFGLFNWFTLYLYITMLTWTCIIFVYTLKLSGEYDGLHFIQFLNTQESQDLQNERRATVRNGEIVFIDRSLDSQV